MASNLPVRALRDLSERDSTAIRDFSEAVRRVHGETLVELRLFGSKARGTDGHDSDIDIAVVVTGKDWRLENSIADLAFEVNVRSDVLITPIVVSEDALHEPVRRITDLVQALQRESIPL